MMTDWLGIGHLLELSGMEVVAGFFTPLGIFAVFLSRMRFYQRYGCRGMWSIRRRGSLGTIG